MGHPFLPEKDKFTAEELEQQENSFRQLLDQLMKKAEECKVVMRVIGSIAFRIRAPEYVYIEYKNNRYLTDIDFIVYSRDIVRVQDMFFELGWSENQSVLRLSGDKRRIFYHPTEDIHSDIFIDKLRFCHPVDFRKRLEIDYPTISLIDLMLEKLQIVEINRKDLVDMMLLLRKYPLSNQEEPDNINVKYLAKICSKNWGWWRTATMNLDKLLHFVKEYLEDKEDIQIVTDKINQMKENIAAQPKSLGWKLRSIFGDKFKWYDEVEEVDRN
ncbi:MAG: hypothetical protein RAO94_03020 [Candidatus Stygibacter australis]|nr:hypothetical protein [Candidatus Stygibacter australis]